MLSNEARLNITWKGQNGDLTDTVHFYATDPEIRQWATEAIRAGSVPGIKGDHRVALHDFVVDRFPATKARPWNLIQIRPRTPFGGDP